MESNGKWIVDIKMIYWTYAFQLIKGCKTLKASQTHICSELFRKHCPGKLFEIDDVLIQKKRNYNYVE